MRTRNPATYTAVPLGSMHVIEVDVGTTVTNERTGESTTVDSDDVLVMKGRVIFCTKRAHEALKARTDQHPGGVTMTDMPEWRGFNHG